ncbi:nSTAND1 domain-containing NTPase [Kitasatospora acidiphila]|uniref:nSTAND1 domain-containing NTPase n=1 Tax=Kitasatospora acidiphila TaxID=2567942 RepID=UPI0015F0E589|nr:trypsin-like peptidase domain-containing protein [Kitasatospora acidiphila]
MSRPDGPGGAGSAGWERATARVLREGEPVGVAFLIPGDLLITCAHVISEVAGLDEDQPLPENFAVTVDFPLASGKPRVGATVHFSVPVAADNSGDVAVLRLTGQPPPDAVPMRVLEADDLAGHRWRAFGFPSYPGSQGNKDAGIWTSGTVAGREGTGWWQLTRDEQAGFPLARGFSGAPVWDEEYQGVVGVVVAVEKDQRRRTGYALTVESLAREWPQLRSRLLSDSPFRELWPFTELDGAVFHGRTDETRRLLELLDEQRVPVIPVFGASGVGKSSLVGAGLLAQADPAIHLTAKLPHGLRLTAEELLAWALTAAGDTDTRGADWHDRWEALARQLTDERGLQLAVEQTLAQHRGRSRLLLVVDQFESLLADAPETARRLDTMLGVLTARRADGSRPAQAVVVTRIDFLHHIEEQLPVLRAAWESTHVVVPPMTREQLRQVVTRPLEGYGGVRFAEGLAEQLVRDTPHGAAALPLLEYTLSQLWARQERGVLTATAYQELGGVEGALVGNAEHTLWEWADASERRALERIFIQLVRPGEELDAGERGPDTRRVADRPQFSEADWALVHRLASTRLVVVTRRPTGLDTAELAHQALVESWPRLKDWVEANRDFRSWQEELRRSERSWQERGRPASLALDRERIADAQRWLDSRAAEISAEELKFVEESRRVRARERRRRGIFALVICVALVAASLATVIAFQQNQKSSVQQRANLSRRLAAQAAGLDSSQPDLAKQLRIAAYHLAPTHEALDALSTGVPLPGSIAAPGATAVSVGGGLLAIATDRTLRLWDLASHADRAQLTPAGGVSTIALSTDGHLLATGSGQGTVQLWDTGQPAAPRLLAELATAHGPVQSLAFASGGQVLASAGWDHLVRAWQLADPTHPRSSPPLGGNTDAVAGVAVSPDGRTLASAGLDHSVRLWDLSDFGNPAALAMLTTPQGVRAVAFDPAGRTVAATGDDSAVHVWDVTDPHSPRPTVVLSTATTPLAALAFSPSGRLLAATGATPSATGTLLWDVSDPAQPAALPALTGGSGALAFTPDGRMMATLDQTVRATRAPDDEVQLWDVGGGSVRAALATIAQPGVTTSLTLTSTALTADGRLLADGGAGAVNLWDVSNPDRPTLAASMPDTGNSVAISGHILAIGGGGGVTFWDLTDHQHPAKIGSVHLGGNQPDEPVAMAFSPDGRLLAAHFISDRRLRVVAVADPSAPTILATQITDGAGTPSFGPQGAVLSLSHDTTADSGSPTDGLWDLRNPAQPMPAATVLARLGPSTATVLSPSQPILATANADGTLSLWDIRDLAAPKALGTATGGTTRLSRLRFSPDGKALVGADTGGGLHLWDVADPEHPSQTADFAQPSEVVGPWLELSDPLPGRDRLVVSPGPSEIAELWDTSPRDQVKRLCATVGDVLSKAQWHQYITETGYAAPCGSGSSTS